jgi:hypothetical protein
MHRITLSKQLYPSFFISLSAFVILTVLYTVSQVSAGAGAYYFRGGTYTALCVVTLVLLLLIPSSIFLCLPRGSAPRLPLAAPLSLRIFSPFASVVAVAFGVCHFGLGIRLIAAQENQCGIFALLTGIFACFGALYLLSALLPRDCTCSRDALAGMSLLFSFLTYAMYLYFDGSTPKNDTQKQFLSLAFLILVLYLLSDVRLVLGRGIPRLYHITALWAAPLCGALSIGGLLSALILRCAPALGYTPLLLLLIFFLYIYIRELTVTGTVQMPSIKEEDPDLE